MIAGPAHDCGPDVRAAAVQRQAPVDRSRDRRAAHAVAVPLDDARFLRRRGQPLPTLNLPRVFVLTGPTTCSASESIINSLRGVDVEVIQIGSTTCGKPYGFYPQDNCGTTYFTIEFKGVNAQGFGDYTDGFAPTNAPGLGGTRVPGCSVADDFTHALGDPAEARLAAALAYRLGPGCPAPSGLAPTGPGESFEPTGVDGVVMKPLWLQNRVLLAR